MIASLIQIENGPVLDFYDAFGFIYLDADERLAADEKDDAVSNYAEEAGEHRDGRTCDAPFDYTATFLIEAPNKDLTNVNVKIAAFNAAVRETGSDSDVKRKRKIAFYNILNRVKIVGYPDIIATPTKVYHSNRYGGLDCATFDLKIRVANPDECDFCLPVDNPLEQGVKINLASDGDNIFVTLSRSLKDDEALLLMRRGRVRNRNKQRRWKGKYRWHVMSYSSSKRSQMLNILEDGKISEDALHTCRFETFDSNKKYGVRCIKASGSKYSYAASAGLTKKITFGCAVFKENIVNGKYYIPKRVSNVVYFASNVKVNEVGNDAESMNIKTWFTV